MRYYQKLVSLLVLVLAASFGVGGCVLLYSDFAVQRGRMATANAAAHAQTCTLLQTEILDLQRRGTTMDDAALTARVEARDTPAALWRGDTLICATLPGLENFSLENAATVTVRTEESVYAVYASDLQGGLRLVTAYDLTGLYRDRDAALTRFLLLEAAVLAAAAAVTALLAARLTRPLAVLTDAGQQIAAGDYARRTALHTGDEIETLSTSFDKMADAVQEKIADLEADVQKREDFVGAFTHELKTPMTSILGFADILRSGEVSPATRRTAADYIYHESKRLEALSGNLLALMGLEQQPPQLEAVPLGRVLQSLRRALPQGSPVPTLPRSDAVVLAQPELLCDMLYNLIQNARKATPADGKVEVLLDETPTRLTIRVQDTGCGIPPQELARITEPFYMVDKSRAREQGGSGMGLALCARIAALHGTTLQFASVPSQGTTVSFCLQKAGSQPEVEP